LSDAGGKRAEVGRCSSKTPQSRRMTLNGDRGLGILDELSAWGSAQKAEGFGSGNPKFGSKVALLVLTAGTSLFPHL